jgi:hypothetical protein
MSRSTVQMRYVGDSLESLVTQATFDAVDRCCRNIASTARDTMDTVARVATPVRYGIVQNAWVAKSIRKEGERYSTGTENSHWLAWMLDVGAKPHEIFPEQRKAELTPEGPRARVPHHPGFTGHRMAERAVETTEAVLPSITTRARERFKAEAEFAIERAKPPKRIL